MAEAPGEAPTADERIVLLISPEGAKDPLARLLGREGYSPIVPGRRGRLDAAELGDGPGGVVVRASGAPCQPAAHIDRWRARFPRAPLIFTSAVIERWEVRAALAAGASGVVLEDDLAAALGPCLRAASVGQTCVPQAHWREIERPVLSTREKQVLGLVVMGYMNSQIAEQLFLAESTVKSHLSSAFGKLGVRSRNEAVELIVNPDRGLGMGILGLGGEPLEPQTVPAR